MGVDCIALLYFGFKINEDLDLCNERIQKKLNHEADKETGCEIHQIPSMEDNEYYLTALSFDTPSYGETEFEIPTNFSVDSATKRIQAFCAKFGIEFQKPSWHLVACLC